MLRFISTLRPCRLLSGRTGSCSTVHNPELVEQIRDFAKCHDRKCGNLRYMPSPTLSYAKLQSQKRPGCEVLDISRTSERASLSSIAFPSVRVCCGVMALLAECVIKRRGGRLGASLWSRTLPLMRRERFDAVCPSRETHLMRTIQIRCAVGMLLCGLIGCGTQTYEQRLAESAKYFEYRQRLDSALELRAWQGNGLELRTPKGFTEIPPPAEDQPDQRQPPFLKKPLPGLVGAWTAELRVDVPESDSPTKPAWIFACSNHRMWLDRETNINIIPANFAAELADTLADNFNFARNVATNPWKFTEERVPKGIPYVPYKAFDYIVLDEKIDGLTYDVILFRYSVKDIQLGIIVLAPQALDRKEKLTDKLLFMMEQLTLSGDIPKSAARKQSASGGGI